MVTHRSLGFDGMVSFFFGMAGAPFLFYEELSCGEV
jgi:hypothetical protein